MSALVQPQPGVCETENNGVKQPQESTLTPIASHLRVTYGRQAVSSNAQILRRMNLI